MRRILVALCLIVSTGGCVNLGKPEKVPECAAKGTCTNTPVDGAPGTPGVDSGSGKDTKATNAGDADTAIPLTDGPVTADDGPLPPDNVRARLAARPASPCPMRRTICRLSPCRKRPGATSGPTNAPEVPIIIDPDAPLDTRDAAIGAPDAPPDIPPDTKDAYRDVAVGICAPGGVIQPAGTVCRAAVGPCDVDETCDGVHADCPADVLAAAGTSCRAAAGDCDVAETCTGTAVACPTDGFKQARHGLPRGRGACDVAESCTGTGATCPVDSLAATTTVCRASTDGSQCDPPRIAPDRV